MAPSYGASVALKGLHKRNPGSRRFPNGEREIVIYEGRVPGVRSSESMHHYMVGLHTLYNSTLLLLEQRIDHLKDPRDKLHRVSVHLPTEALPDLVRMPTHAFSLQEL